MFGTHFRSPNALVPHDSYDFISLPVLGCARVNSNTLTEYESSWLGFVYNVGSYHPQGKAEDCSLGDLFTQTSGLDWSWGLEILLRFLYLHADSEIITPKTKQVHYANKFVTQLSAAVGQG
jgi:hypothetical protein